jgi:hypothetical protein
MGLPSYVPIIRSKFPFKLGAMLSPLGIEGELGSFKPLYRLRMRVSGDIVLERADAMYVVRAWHNGRHIMLNCSRDQPLVRDVQSQ